MHLNLPIFDHLADCQYILIVGAGGGFDIYGGLPLYFALRDAGKQVHLANYTFMDVGLAGLLGRPIIEIEDLLIGAHGPMLHAPIYYPEGYLAQWFHAVRQEEIIVWVLNRVGVVPLAQAYQHLIQKYGIQAVILVDGGVDSLMRGDETAPGTLIDDSVSLAALSQVDVPVKLLACLGFGTEFEEGLCHYHALENMAALAKAGAFYGCCALTSAMPVYQQYEDACRYAWEYRAENSKSHIHTRIIPAVRGEFDQHAMYPDHPSQVFISPFMSLYWFFEAQAVYERNLLAPLLAHTQTADECRQIGLHHYTQHMPKRRVRPIPY